MARIDDLYAIENNIDDLTPIEQGDKTLLTPTEAKVFMMAYRDMYKEMVTLEDIVDTYMQEQDESIAVDETEQGWDINYHRTAEAACEELAEEGLDNLVVDQHIDLTDDEYKHIKTAIAHHLYDLYGEKIAERWNEEYEEECGSRVHKK